jgi:hypothetical protein
MLKVTLKSLSDPDLRLNNATIDGIKNGWLLIL